MITVCMSASGWMTQRAVALSLVGRSLGGSSPLNDSISIDLATIQREAARQGGQVACADYLELDCTRWILVIVAEVGTVDVEAVRRDSFSFPPDKPVILNAIGLQSEVIEKVLTQVLFGIYSKIDWPPAIVVVCDDHQRFQVGPALAKLFQIRPNVLSQAAVDRIARNVLFDGAMLRYFGQAVGSLPKALRKLYKTMFDRLERKRTREFDWVWDE